MKIIIVRTVSEKNRRLITSQFPGDWQIVIVSEEEKKKKNEIKDADVLIPENSPVDDRFP